MFAGELYDVGWGQKLFLSCKGKGQPTGMYQVAHSLTLVALNTYTTQNILFIWTYFDQIYTYIFKGLDKQIFSA